MERAIDIRSTICEESAIEAASVDGFDWREYVRRMPYGWDHDYKEWCKARDLEEDDESARLFVHAKDDELCLGGV